MNDPWKRKEVIGDCTLYLGDCEDIVTGILFDYLVTDPPYGMRRDGKPKSSSSHGGHKGYEFRGWDTEPPSPAFISRLLGLSKYQIIWGANFFPGSLPPSMGWLVWDKGQRIDQSDGELAFTNLGKALRIFTLNRVAIATDGAVHPTQKPVELMKWCIDFLPKGGIVCDPYMGSGSTGVACASRGVEFVGIEQDESYFEVACERIRKACLQPDMFVASQAPQMKQEEMF